MLKIVKFKNIMFWVLGHNEKKMGLSVRLEFAGQVGAVGSFSDVGGLVPS